MDLKQKIEKAFVRYARGERPERYRTPKRWHVLDEKTGESFPLKGIWALANNVPSGSFNTRDAWAGMLEMGFNIVDNIDADPEVDLQKKIEKSLKKTAKKRMKDILSASKKPNYYYRKVKVFVRNADIVAQTLVDAEGFCAKCEKEAPFVRLKDSSPYLEVHHIMRLADGGEDSMENVVALCPNCHRQAHHG